MKNTDEILFESLTAVPMNLRVAVVTETYPPEVNGVAMTLGKIVEGLLSKGHAVQLVRPRQPQENVSSRDGLEQVFAKGMPLPAYGDLRFGLPAKSRMIKLWAENRPDVVHVATEGPLGWSAVAAARKLKIPVTSSFHTNFHSYSQHYGMGLIKRSIEGYLRKLHNQTMATMVPTYALANDLRSRGYQNVTLLSRGVELKQFSPANRSAALRAKWGVTDDTLVFLHVGRLAKEKNIGLLISAYRACLVENPSAKLVFVGDGPLRKQLEESCPQAIFAGVQKGADLAAHYASADIFPFPSVTETFGNVVPEALASGLAVVAYDTASAKELITNGIDGSLVAMDQDLNFISATVAMAKQNADRARMRNAAPRSVADMDWEKIHDAFIATLRSVIDRQGVGLFTASALPRPQPITSASA